MTEREPATLLYSAAAALLLASCGRFHFDPLGPEVDAGDAGDGSATGCVADILANAETTCARTTRGEVYCWGANDNYEIGDATLTDRPAPTRTLLTVAVVDAALGSTHGCAAEASGALWCWGTNQNGAVGDGTAMTVRPMPVLATALAGKTYSGLVAGAHFTCGRTPSAGVECWGINNYYQLADTTIADSLVPVQAMGVANVVTMQSASYTTCALETSGQVACWSRNDYGQFGNGTTTTPTAAVVTPFPAASAMSTGGSLLVAPLAGHTCTVSSGSKEIWCAGSNAFGELGDGTTADSHVPVRVQVGPAKLVAAGTWHTCAALENDTVVCWGRNEVGELGRGFVSAYEVAPTVVTGVHGIVKLIAGRSQTCALGADARLVCWGGNARGAVGDDTMLDRPDAVAIDVPCG